jgi:hypothetical protein
MCLKCLLTDTASQLFFSLIETLCFRGIKFSIHLTLTLSDKHENGVPMKVFMMMILSSLVWSQGTSSIPPNANEPQLYVSPDDTESNLGEDFFSLGLKQYKDCTKTFMAVSTAQELIMALIVQSIHSKQDIQPEREKCESCKAQTFLKCFYTDAIKKAAQELMQNNELTKIKLQQYKIDQASFGVLKSTIEEDLKKLK